MKSWPCSGVHSAAAAGAARNKRVMSTAAGRFGGRSDFFMDEHFSHNNAPRSRAQWRWSAEMRNSLVVAAALVILGGSLLAQENKPVPKDSVRVAIPGCTKGQIFTAAARTTEEAGSVSIPEGMHLRMNGP